MQTALSKNLSGDASDSMGETNQHVTLLTPSDISRRLQLSLTAVYALCDSGELPCYRIGIRRSRRRITEADLAAYLERTRTQNTIIEPPVRRRRATTSVTSGGFRMLRAAGWKG